MTTMVAVTGDRYDAVVFDMDGVITDTATVHAAAWKRTFDAFLTRWSDGHDRSQAPFSDDDYLTYVDGKHRDDGVASFLASRGIDLPRGSLTDPPDRETVWGIANRKNRDFRQSLRDDGVVAFPTSVGFVHRLQAHGIGTAIVSASRNCRDVLEAAGIGDLFSVRVDGIVAEQQSLRGKPAPDIFVEAARRLGARPERAVVVEDAIAGVQAGKAGEFALVIGVDRTGQADALRANGADVVVRDLGEICVDGVPS